MQITVAVPRTIGKRVWDQGVVRELGLSWQFIGGDISSTIVPALLFMGAAWSTNVLSAGAVARAIGSGLLYFWLYIYVFCLSNQLSGVEEDRTNKPRRPLVTGAVSYRGAQMRWLLLMLAFTGVGWLLDVLLWTLLWQTVLVLHNFGGWSRRWYTKNLVMALGVIAQLGAAWELVQPLTPLALRWVLIIAAVVFYLISVQDLRDMEGDRLIGRRTFPLVFGARATRIALAVGFVLLPLVVDRWLLRPAGSGWIVLSCDAVLAALSLTIAVRVLRLRTARADHYTYLLFTTWYCLTLLSAMFVL